MKLAELAAVLEQIEVSDDAMERFLAEFESTNDMGGHVFFIGNGGSAAIASHMAADWGNRAKVGAIALNDAATITQIGNDYGYEDVFRKQLMRVADQGDMVFAISSSGRSENIRYAVESVSDFVTVVTLTGFLPDNPLRKAGHINFYVPSMDYGIVETAHLGILHALLDKVAS